MALSIYNIKRWIKMLTGKSIYHVDQGLGRCIDIGGYYNDLTQKVILGDNNLDKNGIPFLELENGNRVHMPTMIFQYGIGAFDLWLENKEERYIKKAVVCAQWAVDHQKENGSWDNFSYIYPENPYSAMAQGEGASLLLRVYTQEKNNQFLIAAKKAVDYMLTSSQENGVTLYDDKNVYLLEYRHLPVVLNGWIFALWGLVDICKYYPEYERYLNASIETLCHNIQNFDNGYWSLYNSEGLICSPFYHRLQIAQMKAMYIITGVNIFDEYAQRWEEYSNSIVKKSRAFLVKAIQKIVE